MRMIHDLQKYMAVEMKSRPADLHPQLDRQIEAAGEVPDLVIPDQQRFVERPRALDGLRVIDATDQSGAFATRLLADLGANVVRVEPPDGGQLRSMGPFLREITDRERGYSHLYLNANKRSMVVDSVSSKDLTFRHLLTWADVLVESGPRDLAAPNLDPAHLWHANPGLIIVSVSPFGLDGPWSDRRANDLVAAAAGGLLYSSGGPDDPPMQGNADPSYKMAGLQAATGALIGLAARDKCGQGVHVDISLQEATLMAMVQHANANMYTNSGLVPRRRGIFGPLYRCKDGRWAAVRIRPDRFDRFRAWAREHARGSLADASAASETAPDPTGAGEVNSAMAAIACSLTRDEVLQAAWDLDLIALPVGLLDEMGSTDHFVQTQQFLDVAHDVLDEVLSFPRSSADGMASGAPISRAPRLGEHTEAVLGEVIAAIRPRSAAKGRGVSREEALEWPLEGVRVVDFTWVLAGPFGTRILANFGAEVIRVESHQRRDSVRSMVPGASSLDAAPLFNDANTGKCSLTLDLTRPEAREIVLQLVAKADVITNNFRPGALERLGLGYEALKAVNRSIIMVNLPGCGAKGPWASRGTLGGVLMAASGLNDISGFEGRPPYGISTAFPDFTSPYLLALTVLAALRERDRTGLGQEITNNQLSATISLLGTEWMRFSAEGSLSRNANRNPNFAPHGVYAARGEDEWCAIAVQGDDEWRRLCVILGRPELAHDARFSAHGLRKQNEDALDAVIAARTCGFDRWELADRLQQADIAAAAVESLADLYDRDPQVRHRRHYQHVRQPSEPGIDIVVDAEAIRLVGFERDVRRAPMMGEHNEPVLRGLLGLSERRFNELVVAGVIN